MDDLLNNLEKHCIAHLEKISMELDKESEFVCPQMVDDLHDIVGTIKDIREIKAMKKSIV